MKRFLPAVVLLLTCILVRTYAQEPAWRPPQLENAENWSMIIFPDPQQYTCERHFPLYQMMMNWIVEYQKPLNIQTVLVVGDLVNNNPSDVQWGYTSRAFEKLDGKLPYVVCLGNHDLGTSNADTRETQLDRYFPASRNSCWDGTLVEQMENTFGQKTLEIAAYELTAPGGQKLLVISLPFGPNDAMLDWAKSVCTSEQYANHLAILVTHQYMLPHARNDIHDPGKGYKIQREAGGNSGLEIWEKLVKTTPNIRMVFCGHHSANDNMMDCTGFRTDVNDAGKTVYQMVFDTQAMGGGFGGNGGDGWLRVLEFSPDMKQVKAYTFSPFFAISPSTRAMAFDRSDYCEFRFEME